MLRGGSRMRARHSATLTSLAVSLLLALVLPSCASTTTTQSVPHFESTPCMYKLGQGIVEGTTVRCGFLIVREDRANPHSRTIKLAVAILKTPSSTPAPDPVIYLSGGP